MARTNELCSFPDCKNPRRRLDLCRSHGAQRDKGKPLTAIKPYAKRGEIVALGCLAEHCSRLASTRGLCRTHYRASRRGAAFGRLDQRDDEWFYARAEDVDGCWEWRGGLTDHGYGHFKLRGVHQSAHRWSYEFMRGEIPDGLVIDHLCRNRACVNPWHMEPVTQWLNVMRGISPHAMNKRKTHCIHGHEFTSENTIPRRNGARRCRQCMNDYNSRVAATRYAKAV